ncbi:MAG: VWA domain-containing protein [Acidobacteriaceae bacterium]|nr:VWA domain-containing protein [Acidobacteriaceae bacterium]MBV9297083.1 VWA domain-containing protein [Acidobacteriaceae bacterium]
MTKIGGIVVHRRSFFSVLALASLAMAALASSAQQGSDPGSTLKLRAETTLVLIPVSVTDASNRYVLGLERQDFHIFEDGTEQKVTQFSGEDAPLSVGLLVDTSGSMGEKINISRQAVTQFLKTMNSKDEAFLIEFSDRADLAVGFTSHSADIEEKLGSVESQGLTALLDAVHLGLSQMKTAMNPRKALLIISDGGDNNSRYSAAEIKDLVREADVQIYAMGVFEPFASFVLGAAELSGPRLLSQLAEQTGGRAFAATRSSDLPGIATRIGIELRNQYVLAYPPLNQQHNGKYRKVEVKLNQPQGLSPLKARWRLGYYAPAQ